MYELLYTSAPEGLKRGSSGFCTVAATEGMPRPLMDRLEALSAYRHHPGISPVAHAHWLLNITGKEYHVLSRICDSGLDHTQRTNAFAHHIALDGDALPAGGPAWVLAQAGVLLDRFDGVVGERPARAGLPMGDQSPAPCTLWQTLTGDAGYAGTIVEHFLRMPRRPLCLIFAPGMDLLALLREVVALVPAAQRWNATFNTYYTSMPTSASCAWRCCLTGTPAAVEGGRYAANGLLLNLAEPGRLPKLVESPWTEAARTGQPPRAALKMPLMPTAPAMRAPAAVPVAALPLEMEPPPPEHSAADDNIVINRGHRPAVASYSRNPSLFPTDKAEKTAPKQKKSWRQLALIYLLACGAIGGGTWLLVMAYNAMRESPDDIPLPPPRHVNIAVAPVAPPPSDDTGATATQNSVPLFTPTDTAPAPAPTPAPGDQNPVDQTPVVIAPTVPQAPKTVRLRLPLAAKTLTGGMTDIVQSFALRPQEFSDFDQLQTLALNFPNGAATYKYDNGELSGTLEIIVAPKRPMLSIVWVDAANPTARLDVFTALIRREKLLLSWKHRAVLNQPEVYTLAYWLVSNSALLATSAGHAEPDRIEFPPAQAQTAQLTDPESVLSFPMPLPQATIPVTAALDGWKSTLTAPTAATATAPASPDGYVLTLSRGEGTPYPMTFSLTFARDYSRVKSDFAAQKKTLDDALTQVQQEQKDAQGLIDQLSSGPQLEIDTLSAQLTGKRQQLGMSDEDLDKQGLKRTSLLSDVADLQDQLERHKAALAETVKAPQAALATVQAKRNAIDQALAYDAALQDIDISLQLPGNITLATIKILQKSDKNATDSK